MLYAPVATPQELSIQIWLLASRAHGWLGQRYFFNRLNSPLDLCSAWGLGGWGSDFSFFPGYPMYYRPRPAVWQLRLSAQRKGPRDMGIGAFPLGFVALGGEQHAAVTRTLLAGVEVLVIICCGSPTVPPIEERDPRAGTNRAYHAFPRAFAVIFLICHRRLRIEPTARR